MSTPENRTEDAQPDVGELREQIAETRDELGDTVEALAQKADVKRQVKEKVEEQKQRAGAQPAVAGGALLVLLLVVLPRSGGAVVSKGRARSLRAVEKTRTERRRVEAGGKCCEISECFCDAVRR